ncbi:MAG TPA: hypothetical protein VNN09_00205 [Candidatus Competibacteraceae bacterium]|nr:hypothetical protein [Candidatus Competibacteraceae bacterium]
MSKENLRLPDSIGCLDSGSMLATLVSTIGNHCEVWRTTRVVMHEGRDSELVDLVIKCHRLPCDLAEIRILARDYRELRRCLDSMVPETLYVATTIDGAHNVIAIAEAVQPWFNLANPAIAEDGILLLRRLHRARAQLQRFVKAARHWYAAGKLIDLYGLDNLVLDMHLEVRYIDSFNVFFYTDMLERCGEPDPWLAEKMEISLRRLEYLEYALAESVKVRVGGYPPA